MREIKPVVTEKYDIEYGDESKKLAHLNSWDSQSSDAKIKLVFYLNINAKASSFRLRPSWKILNL